MHDYVTFDFLEISSCTIGVGVALCNHGARRCARAVPEEGVSVFSKSAVSTLGRAAGEGGVRGTGWGA